jgi:hypothetical protein
MLGTNYEIFDYVLPERDFFGIPLAIHGPYEVVSDHAVKYHSLRHYDVKILLSPRVYKYHNTLAEMDLDE